MNAAPVSIAAFEFLDNPHQDIQTQIKRLHALVDVIEKGGLNLANRRRARRVLDGFNREACPRCIDERKHTFPALLVGQIAPSLEAAASGNPWFDSAELRRALEVFEARYLGHVLLEESIACPEARKPLAGLDTLGMGREMAQRRVMRRVN